MKRTPLFYLLLVGSIILLNSLFVQARYNEEKAFVFIKKLFERRDRSSLVFLTNELKYFLQLFPANKNAPGAQAMLSVVYQEQGKKHQTIVSHLKMIYLYPHAKNISEHKKKLSNLIKTKSPYARKNISLKKLLEKKVDQRSATAKYFAYLGALMQIKVRPLYDLTLESCREFTRLFPKDHRNEQILLWISITYINQRKYHEANIYYDKFAFIYPKSKLLPFVLYKQSLLRYQHLGKYQKALDLLEYVVYRYSYTDYASMALLAMGEITENKLKEHHAAIGIYQKLLKSYPKTTSASKGLWRIAKINQTKLKNYEAAIDAYDKILRKYPGDKKNVDVLKEIAKLYLSHLRIYPAAADTYAKMVKLYPKHPKAPEWLLKAGEIYERKLEDYLMAISYYQQVLTEYPRHIKFQEAKKRTKRLEDRILTR